MLILTRRPGESIVIVCGDPPVRIEVVEMQGNKVRLGIDAPRHVAVHRFEVYREIRRRWDEIERNTQEDES